MPFSIESHGATDVGRAREENEDNFIVLPEDGLYLVCDGMGGHASGKLASTLAVSHAAHFFAVQSRAPGFSFPYSSDNPCGFEGNLLANSIQHGNQRIYIEAMKNPAHEGMGTTAVGIFDPGHDHLILGHAGDSRIYRSRDGQLQQLTVDHSLVNHLLRTKQITPEEAEDYPNKNVIFRALGLKDYVEVEIQRVGKQHGDVFLLCSDGLTDLVEDWVIAEVLQNAPKNLEDAAETLIRLANHNGGVDNITVILMVVKED